MVPPYTSFDRSVSQKSGQKPVAKPIACEKEAVTVSSTTKTPPADKKTSNPQIMRSPVTKTNKINIMHGNLVSLLPIILKFQIHKNDINLFMHV